MTDRDKFRATIAKRLRELRLFLGYETAPAGPFPFRLSVSPRRL